MIFPKKRCCNKIFLVLSGKITFLLPENMILHLRRKMKMIFLQKIHGIRYCLQTIWKDGLFKRDGAGTWSFFSYLERWYFFSRKHDIFSLGRKWESTFLKKYMEIWYFLCTSTGVTNVVSRTSVKKIQRWSYLAKIHLKVIDVLDWHIRKSSSNFLYFHGDLYKHFHLLLSSEKTRKLNM